MKHNTRKISRDSARITFELDDKRFPTRFLKIWRIRKHNDTSVSRAEGIVIGENRYAPRALIVKVLRGDAVVICQQTPHNQIAFLHEYKISETFEPLVGNIHRLKAIGAAMLFDRIEIDKDRNSGIREIDLKLLFRSSHPIWMESLVSDYLEYQREHAVKTFLNIAPHCRVLQDLQLLVSYDPLRALRDHKSLLTKVQLATCIRKDPSAGMRYAFECVPRTRRKIHLREHANHLLKNHLHLLTNSELKICSNASPKAAFLLRGQVPPRQHSIILARSYGVVWHTLIGEARKPFHKETFRSLATYPEEWLAESKNGFEEIFRKLKHLLGINFRPSEFRRLLKNMPPRGQKALAKYIGSNV